MERGLHIGPERLEATARAMTAPTVQTSPASGTGTSTPAPTVKDGS